MVNLAKAILVAMNEIGYLQKDKQVGEGSNAYKGLSDQKATQGIRDALMKAGIVALNTKCRPTKNCKVQYFETINKYNKPVLQINVFTEVKMTYTLIHAESGESMTVQALGHGTDNGDKAAGKAMTFARKNSLLNALLISSGNDPEEVHSDDLPTPPTPPPPTFEEDLAVFGKASRLAKWYAEQAKTECPEMLTAEEADRVARELYKKHYKI